MNQQKNDQIDIQIKNNKKDSLLSNDKQFQEALQSILHQENQKQEVDIINYERINDADIENQVQQAINQPQQSRPSPNQESYSQSNTISRPIKIKPPPLSSELIRLTKKCSTTSVREKDRKERQKKVRYYITDFEPYLPSFLDELHKEHHKNIVRIGQNYQAYVSHQPKYEYVIRSMNHLRIWKGSEQTLCQQALKKFKQLYGQNRTQQELILLKHRLQIENWVDLTKQMIAQKAPGKKSTLIIAPNNIHGATTRTK